MNVLLTGGSQGLGLSLARYLLKQNCKITILDIKKPNIKNINYIKLDLANIKATIKTIENFDNKKNKFDLLILNAGISAVGKFEKISPQAHKKILHVNLLAPMLFALQFVKNNKIKKHGKIIFISSLSHFTAYPAAATYGASKSALAIYAKSIKKALAKKNIKVLTVFPGPIDTEHAKKYAPKGASGKNRMNPDVLAKNILRRSSGYYIPAFQPLFIAFLAKLFPHFIAKMMKKIIFDKF